MAAASTATTRRPSTKGEQTRRAILAAAIERFGREGYRATSVADIARDAGVGGTVAYAYFPNKETLFLAAIDEDASHVINEGLVGAIEDLDVDDWRQMLVFTLISALDHHPPARPRPAGRCGRVGAGGASVADIARGAGGGGTVAYAYFPNKETLFLAAIDEDAGHVINEGLVGAIEDLDVDDWRQMLVFTLISALDHHPLARRVLAGLEPEVTERVLEIPALGEMRRACAERIRDEQGAEVARPDIAPVSLKSEESRVGKECISNCISRWSVYAYTKISTTT